MPRSTLSLSRRSVVLTVHNQPIYASASLSRRVSSVSSFAYLLNCKFLLKDIIMQTRVYKKRLNTHTHILPMVTVCLTRLIGFWVNYCGYRLLTNIGFLVRVQVKSFDSMIFILGGVDVTDSRREWLQGINITNRFEFQKLTIFQP
jgi:hypothetical protein